MRILMVHNRYQNSGGEDQVFKSEIDLLCTHGHTVTSFEDDNKRISHMPAVVVAMNTLWAEDSKRNMMNTIIAEKPQLVHFHNTFPLISPSAYYACRAMNVPIVQTLHNYRLLCPAATLYRDSKVCEKCLGSFFAWHGVRYACYRDSKLQTAGVSTMVSLHKILGTWNNLVNVYIALTDFSRQKFIEGGLPASRIIVKPNFIAPDPGWGTGGGGFGLFVGRLSNEKGIFTMLKAWRALPSPVPLKIIGDGPLHDEVLQYIEDNSLKMVELLGATHHDQVLSLMKRADFLVFPSEWYEGFPMVIVEAFACGLPIISSALGGMNEIIADKDTGMFFTCGDANDLAEKICWAIDHPSEMSQMRLNARNKYLQCYSEEKAYQNVIKVYNSILRLPVKP